MDQPNSKDTQPTFESVLYDEPRPHIARVTMNRPEKRNAQNMQLTYDINSALDYAVREQRIKIIVLAGAGAHFSAGHDFGGDPGKTYKDFPLVSSWANFEAAGAEGRFSREMEIFLEITERWRNLSKPMIAQVQGKCITGGLMLAWCCDIIIASEDAEFICTSTKMGGTGVEFWAYPWEIGPRRAKQWMLTDGRLSAQKAQEFGMVNEITSRDNLEQYTLDFAEKMAKHTTWTLNMTKLAVNHAQDLQGRRASIQYAFMMHQLGHAHRVAIHGTGVDTSVLSENLQAKYRARQERQDLKGL